MGENSFRYIERDYGYNISERNVLFFKYLNTIACNGKNGAKFRLQRFCFFTD